MGNKAVIVSIVSAIILLWITNVSLAVPPVPGTYDPQTLTFYETGLKVPNFIETTTKPKTSISRSTMKVVTILQQASDVAHTVPVADFQEMLYSTDTFPTGSMRDYYEEVSYGQFMLDGHCTGWYTAPQTYAYYVQGAYGFPPTGHADEFVRHAIQNADPDVNFAQYDNDGDGIVEGVIVIHQGPGGEGGNPNYFWSHKGWLNPPEVVDGVTVEEYSLNPEVKEGVGTIESIGVFAHEFGHQLGLPDLYDTSYSGFEPVGRYCLMGEGSYNGIPSGSNPAHFMAFCKAKLGWVTPTVLTEPQDGLPLADIKMVHSAQSCYRLNINGSTKEYFLIENRWSDSPAFFDKRGTGYDSGLFLQHCYDDGNSGGSPWFCYIKDANPNVNFYRDAAFAAEDNQKECTPYSGPTNTHGYDLASGIILKNVSNSGGSMTFSIDLKPVLTFDHFDVALPEADGDISLTVYVKNLAYKALDPTATLTCSSSQVVITKNTATYANIQQGVVAGNASDPFVYHVTNSGPKGEVVTFTLTFHANTFDLTYCPVTFNSIVNTSDILLVDDDQSPRNVGQTYDTYFKEALDAISAEYDVWENAVVSMHVAPYAVLKQYPIVIWSIGPSYNKALTDEEKYFLSQYLDNGGNLFIAAQEYLYQEYKYPNDDDYVATTNPGEFPHDYLHITSVEQDEYIYRVLGVAGNPITAGMDVALTDVFSVDPLGTEPGDYDWWPDNFTVDDQATPIFTAMDHTYPTGMNPEMFDDSVDMIPNGPCGMMYPKEGVQGTYKVVFLSFGFEGMPVAARSQFLTNLINWFEVPNTCQGISVETNKTTYHANDPFTLTVELCNTGAQAQVDEYVILDVWGAAYYFYPSWTEELNFNPITLASGANYSETILEFTWPSGAGNASGIRFWAALLESGTTNIFGSYDWCEFGWE